MALDLDAVGRTTDEVHVTWTPTDVLLYNLAVGAGQHDPLAELDLTTENSEGHDLRPVPSFVLSLVQANSPKPYLGDFDQGNRLHGEQSFRLHAPLPSTGSAVLSTTVAGIYDRGSGALVDLDTTVRDDSTGRVLAETRMGSFIRGEGGFGGPPAPARPWDPPPSAADHEIPLPVRADQALLYRLCGDRNQLHSDPVFARRSGFERPILHGLCTLGMACRTISAALYSCGDGPNGMSARFVKPVLPGALLRVRLWCDHRFQVLDEAGDLVLDRGRLLPHQETPRETETSR